MGRYIRVDIDLDEIDDDDLLDECKSRDLINDNDLHDFEIDELLSEIENRGVDDMYKLNYIKKILGLKEYSTRNDVVRELNYLLESE